jgi:hypothetical protein
VNARGAGVMPAPLARARAHGRCWRPHVTAGSLRFPLDSTPQPELFMNRQPRLRDARQPQGVRPAATQACLKTRRGNGRANEAADAAQIAVAGGGITNSSG